MAYGLKASSCDPLSTQVGHLDTGFRFVCVGGCVRVCVCVFPAETRKYFSRLLKNLFIFFFCFLFIYLFIYLFILFFIFIFNFIFLFF